MASNGTLEIDSSVEVFCRQVRSRSEEHRKAIALLHSEDLRSPLVGILRQELDSLVRVVYLLSERDGNRRRELLRQAVDGEQWTETTPKGKQRRITDRDMVNLAQQLHGWTASVYSFGCAFIHLTRFHDHRHRDPLRSIPRDEQTAILRHMRSYHHGPPAENPSFDDLVPYLPQAFTKIADNLECYLKQLEIGGTVDDY